MIRPDRNLNPLLLLACLVVLLPPVALLLFSAGREVLQSGSGHGGLSVLPPPCPASGPDSASGHNRDRCWSFAGLATALMLWRARASRLGRLRWLVACFLIVPSYVHAQTWIFATDALRDLLQAAGCPSSRLQACTPACWFRCSPRCRFPFCCC